MKIKVAQVITRLDWGGAPDIVRVLCERLDPDIYDVWLITGPTKYSSRKTGEFLTRFRDRTIVIPCLKRDINPFFDILAFVKLCRLFSKERFDVIHTHTAKAGLLGRLAGRLAGCKAILHTPHGHNFYGYFTWLTSQAIILIEKFATLFTDKFIALTELEKKDMVRFRVAKDGKVAVIYQGLELSDYEKPAGDPEKARRELNIEPDQSVVGMVGRLEAIKGPYYFVEAAYEVVKTFPRAKFVVVGEGSLRRSIEAGVEDLGLSGNFIFTGWRDDVPEVMRIFDIEVLPSLNEAVGIVLIEAQAAGVPVVATNVGGIPEIMKDKETGILVPPADSRALSGAIIALLSDKDSRSRMGENGKAWVRGKFSSDMMVGNISALYQAILDGQNKVRYNKP
ncbi:MAG: glycosyltransferase family 4 protein [Candidatus Omnitrophica bacterium]|nr:glycosyltransferase family 4 protein [Candidatus Omnitrophota bacterium]